MKYLIIDDEVHARNRMRQLLEVFPELELIGEASDGLQAVERIEERKPDLIFLDIEMPGLNGFEVIQNLKTDRPPKIIFVTAYDEFAIKAFEVEAIDYLVKPVSPDRLEKTIKRVIASSADKERVDDKKIKEISSKIGNSIHNIPVREGDRIKLTPVNKVLFFKFENRIIFTQTSEKRFDTHFESLRELEGRLENFNFFRINRNFLINLDLLDEIIPWGNACFHIKLKNYQGELLEVSREQSKKLRKIYGL